VTEVLQSNGGFEGAGVAGYLMLGGRNGLVAAYLNWPGRQEQADGYLSRISL
jgi:hypothetical protein